MPRFYCAQALATGQSLFLPPGAARHVQVLRLQPGSDITLFNGLTESGGGEFDAKVVLMGRSEVQVEVGAHHAVQREARLPVHLAVGMPANDRMDWLVEKATELGVASIQPLMTERSVLRLSGERADKKVAHWHSVAIASCEQCGGNQVPGVHPIRTLNQWLAGQVPPPNPLHRRLLLSLGADTQAVQLHARNTDLQQVTFLSGPEGGLSATEEQAARQAGFEGVSLGPRVLRAETAALAALVAFLV
ncbi:MAG: 16S rRNA (uracil(1498)-N(3))-methyltransferase [Burkholderiales bacterium PBB3]|nr:MAG: 16S rRNA (uracil(1498)-N(3))-methyltransferase [Burkholderiales bacterium PBB3]